MTRRSPTSIADQVAEYQRKAEERDSLGMLGPAAKANKLFDAMHVIAKELRMSEEGRRGLEALTDHPRAGVRLNAAAHVLLWAPELAVPVLEAISRSSGPDFGLSPTTARYTLKAFHEGTLNLDW